MVCEPFQPEAAVAVFYPGFVGWVAAVVAQPGPSGLAAADGARVAATTALDDHERARGMHNPPGYGYCRTARFLNGLIVRAGCAWRLPTQIPYCDQASMSSSCLTFGNIAKLWTIAAMSAGLFVSS